MNIKRLSSACAFLAAMMLALPVSAAISPELNASIEAAVSSGDSATLKNILSENGSDAGEIAQLIVTLAADSRDYEAASAAIATALAAAETLAADQPEVAASIAREAVNIIDSSRFTRLEAGRNSTVAANLLAASVSAAKIAATPQVQVANPTAAFEIAAGATTVASAPNVANSDPALAVAVVVEAVAVIENESLTANVSRVTVLKATSLVNRNIRQLQRNRVVQTVLSEAGEQGAEGALAAAIARIASLRGTASPNAVQTINSVIERIQDRATPQPTPTPYQA